MGSDLKIDLIMFMDFDCDKNLGLYFTWYSDPIDVSLLGFLR